MKDIILVSLLVFVGCVYAGTLQAGVAKLNGTLPVGTPLAGYNHGAR